MIKFALAGNPNCGKTTLFNSLTGSTAHVGNWPGVTVDKKEGVYKKCAEPISIIDLPGIYSLSPYTPEEVISRNYILDEKPDCIINIVDATNLERNLYLTTQIMEIDVPMVIALNMMDAVEKNGDKIDVKKLEEKIGLPVVEISALKEKGLDELMQRAYEVSKQPRVGTTVLAENKLIHLISDCKIALEGQKVENALFHAIKLVELDEIEVNMHPDSAKMVEEFKKTFNDDTFGSDFEAIVADSRYKYISANYSHVLTKKTKSIKEKLSKSDKVDKVLTHKVWGIPIFLVVLFLIFHLTFSEDFLYLGAGGVFDKDVYAYNAQGVAIETFYDAEGNELDKLTDESGEVVELYDANHNLYEVFYDEDRNEVELVINDDGELEDLSVIPYAYDAKKNGSPIKTFYDAEGNELSKLADEEGNLLPLYDANHNEYKKFYNADGYEVKLVLNDDGEFEDVEFVSEIDAFCSEVTANTIFGYEEGIFSPGVILQSIMVTFTDFLSACISQGLSTAAPWVSGLIVDGIFGGLFSILSFLPQILLLFLFFSILEDSGYMARIAFILDRIFRRFGLSGRAFMPMIMGFGCSVPAMINTRTLADQNERTATIRVIPFFSCGAKLPILTAIAGGIASLFGFAHADLITYGMYLLGVVVAICCVLLMRNTSMKGDVPPFIMELPAYHAPQFKNLMLHLWDKTKHFVKKAFTIILVSTILIWFISHFSWNWKYLPDEEMNNSILAGIGGLIRPLFTPLGFGSQLKGFGWVFVVAAVTGLIAKENVIATFGTLAACITSGMFVADEGLEGVDSVVQMISETGITVPALIAFIAFNMLTIPCFAAVATAKAELPTKSSYRWTLFFWIAVSYVVSMMVYLIGSWWWTLFIFLVIWAGIITLIVLNNKGILKVDEFFAKVKRKLTRAKAE
ncbi:MAG: ferrous iron transporter B [Bacteroides sp.]|nr:ferrous iron transporter B [Bacillota bacterium]MCM1393954.1 ferrous iron transporter B [[Eubacterium] siraeum]MCM1455138.1 ferrous iron transporter B [Bacteroides sp.]